MHIYLDEEQFVTALRELFTKIISETFDKVLT